MAWDYFPDWFKRRMRRSPFFSSWLFDDIDEIMKEIEETMQKVFKA